MVSGAVRRLATDQPTNKRGAGRGKLVWLAGAAPMEQSLPKGPLLSLVYSLCDSSGSLCRLCCVALVVVFPEVLVPRRLETEACPRAPQAWLQAEGLCSVKECGQPVYCQLHAPRVRRIRAWAQPCPLGTRCILGGQT